MAKQSEKFIKGGDVAVEPVADGVTRQIFGYDPSLMLVRVMFEAGGEGYVHDHFHSQVSYVESGVFDVNIDGEVRTLTAGDSFYIPPHASHGAVCKEAGVLIDVFSPVREDLKY